MLPISVCIIAKNEEKHIAECLLRLLPFEPEIVLVDTGSTDRTIELAQKYASRIYHFDWCNDFSAARNYAMSKASHNWILSLDCDEYVESLDMKSLLQCMEQYPDCAGRILIRNRFTENGQTSYEQVWVSRFVNRQYYRFEGSVHEQLVPLTGFASGNLPFPDELHRRQSDASGEVLSGQAAAQNNDGICTPVKRVYNAPVRVLHVGYDGSETEMNEKCRRNILLLEKELQESGADPYLYYQLGQSYRKLHDYETAYKYFDLGLSMDVDPALDYVQTMVESYGYTLLDLKRSQDALNLLGVYDTFAVRADFVFLMGLIYMNNGLFEEAIGEFNKAATMGEFAVDGVNSYKANYNIGVIYECTGHADEARKAYRKCGAYEPAKSRLKQLNS